MDTNVPMGIAAVAIVLAFATSACQRTAAPEPSPASRVADAEAGAIETPSASPSPPQAPNRPTSDPRSVPPGLYTALLGPDCEVLKTDAKSGGSSKRCPGMGGYRLLVHDSDARMSLEVEPPRGNPQPLDLWRLSNGAFSGLGERAEWRLDGAGQPFALIVRYNAYLQPEEPDRATSYLVVVKLKPPACIVDVMPPGPGQNERARDAADAAAGMACRTPPER